MEVSLYFPSILLSENKPKVVRFKVLTSSNLLQIIVPSLELCPGGGLGGEETAQLGKDNDAFRGQEGSGGKTKPHSCTAGSSVPFAHDTELGAFGTRRLGSCRMQAHVREVFLSEKNSAPVLLSKENNLLFMVREQV